MASDIVTKFRPDAPIVLNASFDRGDADRRYIDTQILGTQQQLVATSFGGGMRSFFQLSPFAPGTIVPGVVFCLSPDLPAGSNVIQASSTTLNAVGGAPLGVCLGAALPGTTFLGLFRGVLPPNLFSLGPGLAGPIGVDVSSGYLKRLPSPTPSDYVMGACDVNGTCSVTGSAAGASVVSLSTTTSLASIAAVTAAPGWNVIGAFPVTGTGVQNVVLDVIGSVSDPSLTLTVRLYCVTPGFVGPVVGVGGTPGTAVITSTTDHEVFSSTIQLQAGRLYQVQAQVTGAQGDDYFGLVRRATPF
jgi:hypothetical protein